MKTKHVLITVALLLALYCGYVFYALNRAFGTHDQRTVQILESRDKQHQVHLIWRHSFLDLNFLIELDGNQIYRSPDFKADYTNPYREVIYWDESGRHMIFEVSGKRLFGYDIVAKRKISDAKLVSLKPYDPQ